MKSKVLLNILLLMLFSMGTARAAQAGAHLTLTPPTGTYSNGQTFEVVVGVDSGTDTSTAVDVWGLFDATKLEIVSIDPLPDGQAAFNFQTEPHIFNDTGKFDFMAASDSTVAYEDKVLSGGLMKITFKAKNTGTASVTFSCAPDNSIDSNIFKTSGTDIIDCASNQSGSYTITAAVGGTDDDTTDDTSDTVETTSKGGELPQTGGVGPTMLLMVVGVIGLIGAFVFKLI